MLPTLCVLIVCVHLCPIQMCVLHIFNTKVTNTMKRYTTTYHSIKFPKELSNSVVLSEGIKKQTVFKWFSNENRKYFKSEKVTVWFIIVAWPIAIQWAQHHRMIVTFHFFCKYARGHRYPPYWISLRPMHICDRIPLCKHRNKYAHMPASILKTCDTNCHYFYDLVISQLLVD